MKIFPEYELKEASLQRADGLEYHILIESGVRKKYHNKWYIIPVICRYENPIAHDLDVMKIKEDAVRGFINQCYRALVYYKIDGALKMEVFSNGRYKTLVELDTDQRSEEDRLNNIIRYNKIKFV